MKNFGKMLTNINRRSLKYGSASALLIVAVVAIAVVLNLMVDTVQNKNLIKTKFDLTSNHLYSIGDKSKEILKGLTKDVTIYGLMDIGTINSNSTLKQIKEVLDQYAKYPHVKVVYIDPDKNPGILKTIDASGLKDIKSGDFVVKSGNKVRKLLQDEIIYNDIDQQTMQSKGSYFTGEQGFTGAIKYVTSDKTPVIYFTSGHGEGTLDSNYKNLSSMLSSNNYDVKSINTITSDKIPEDAQIVIMASPKLDITADEVSKIGDFLKNGGNFVVLVDSQENDTKFTQLEALLSDYNIGINYDKVKENDDKRRLPNDSYTVALDVPRSTIIPYDNLLLVMSNSRSLNTLKNKKSYITVTSLIKTSDKAVGEQIDKSRGKDNVGPLDLALASENKGGAKSSKVLLMGNGLFISDSSVDKLKQYYQSDFSFFTLALNWMMDKKDDVVIEPKNYSDMTQMTINSQTQAAIIEVLVVIFYPLLILGTGLFVWMRRRHL